VGKIPYIPDRGEAVWLDFNPRIGKEQSERRPALVLSKKNFNKALGGMALVCPITSREPRNELEIAIPKGYMPGGTILAHQVKMADLVERKAEKAGHVPIDVVNRTSKAVAILAGYKVDQ